MGILGLSYKPGSPVVEESQGFLLAEYLLKKNLPVIIYDPLITSNTTLLTKSNNIIFTQSWKKVLSMADIVVFANNDPVFDKITEDDFKQLKNKIIIDCWRLFKYLSSNQTITYIPLGVGNSNNYDVIKKLTKK